MLPRDLLEPVSGFGRREVTAGYVLRPESTEQIADAFELCRSRGVQCVLRGAGRSYGDAATLREGFVLDLTPLNRILDWNAESGIVTVEPGVTIEQLWRHCLPEGYWPPVVTGTMKTSLGGALAMNVHGKNAFSVGPIGEHVTEFEFVSPGRGVNSFRPYDPAFRELIGSAGLFGAFTKISLQMKRVKSGNLRAYAESPRSWDEQFALFDQFAAEADYMVSWVDSFASGGSAGRGQFHSANYASDEDSASLSEGAQDLPSRIMRVVPKAQVHRVLKLFASRPAVKMLNASKNMAGRILGNRKHFSQSLVGFSFLLGYVPKWDLAYGSGGFIQYQTFLPQESAKRVFAEQLDVLRDERLEPYLAVLKQHRSDEFLISHGVNGFSLALDIPARHGEWEHLQAVLHGLNDTVLANGGKFYLAKDSSLRPPDFRAWLGDGSLSRLGQLKAKFDPSSLLTSDLAQRVHAFNG